MKIRKKGNSKNENLKNEKQEERGVEKFKSCPREKCSQWFR
jgi:hypothetical protein